MAATRARVALVALAAATLAGVAGAATPPAPPGILVLATEGPDELAIAQMDTRGRGWKVIGRAGYEPVFSRDGRMLAFISGEFRELWVAAADGTQARRIVRVRGPSMSRPTWSPDGRRIAYSGASPVGAFDRRAGLWIVDVATHSGRFVAPMWAGGDPDWSPDGRWFAYSPGNNADLWLMSNDGKRKRRLTTGPEQKHRWSPGGRWIAYEAWPLMAEPFAVRIIEPTTGRVRTLANAAQGPLAWSPDGAWLAYTTTFAESGTYEEVYFDIRMRRIRDGASRLVLHSRIAELYGMSWRRG